MEDLKSKKKIFITGGTGFIGKYLVEKLKKDNDLLLLSQVPFELSGVKILEGDLSDIDSWREGVRGFSPEVTIHLAWEGIPDYGSEVSIKNLNYGLDLMKMLVEIGCQKVIFAGSCWEYGGQSGEISEDAPTKSCNAFTAAKNSLHWLAREIAKKNDIQFIWTRFFYVYGPGQRKESLIPYLIDCVKKNKLPEIKNPLAQNDFVYVEDVAEAVCLLAESQPRSEIYNIGSGYLTSVQEIINLIYGNFGIKKECKNMVPGSTDIFTGFWADISKIKKEIGWQPKTNIEDGIKKTIDCYQNQ